MGATLHLCLCMLVYGKSENLAASLLLLSQKCYFAGFIFCGFHRFAFLNLRMRAHVYICAFVCLTEPMTGEGVLRATIA